MAIRADGGKNSPCAVDALPFYEAEAKKRQGARNDLKTDIVELIPPSSDLGKARDHAANYIFSGKIFLRGFSSYNNNPVSRVKKAGLKLQ